MIRRGRRGRKNQDIDTERQYARVAFVCTPDRKDLYVRAADEGGVSLSAWLVGVADKAVSLKGGDATTEAEPTNEGGCHGV